MFFIRETKGTLIDIRQRFSNETGEICYSNDTCRAPNQSFKLVWWKGCGMSFFIFLCIFFAISVNCLPNRPGKKTVSKVSNWFVRWCWKYFDFVWSTRGSHSSLLLIVQALQLYATWFWNSWFFFPKERKNVLRIAFGMRLYCNCTTIVNLYVCYSKYYEPKRLTYTTTHTLWRSKYNVQITNNNQRITHATFEIIDVLRAYVCVPFRFFPRIQ